MLSLFCFGLGYTAKYFIKALRSKDLIIGATARSFPASNHVEGQKYRSFLFDGKTAGIGIDEYIHNATHILISVPPDEKGDPILRYHSESIANSGVQWIGYLSTIGVYGDHAGKWVDENTSIQPTSERSRRRVLAENSWKDFGKINHKRVEIFRLAGIYGPGRNLLDELINGTAATIVKKDQIFNRIHVEDIASTLIASLSSAEKYSIYNITDDEPASQQDVHAFAAKLLGIPSPPQIPFEQAHLSDMARSFYQENKRVRNDRIKKDLGIKLLFPTYREGLTHLAKGYKKDLV